VRERERESERGGEREREGGGQYLPFYQTAARLLPGALPPTAPPAAGPGRAATGERATTENARHDLNVVSRDRDFPMGHDGDRSAGLTDP